MKYRRNQFRFLRADCLPNLKGSEGLILAKASDMRISIPLDLSSRPFIPLPPPLFFSFLSHLNTSRGDTSALRKTPTITHGEVLGVIRMDLYMSWQHSAYTVWQYHHDVCTTDKHWWGRRDLGMQGEEGGDLVDLHDVIFFFWGTSNTKQLSGGCRAPIQQTKTCCLRGVTFSSPWFSFIITVELKKTRVREKN